MHHFPGEAQAVENAETEILHQDVALLEQGDEHLLACRILHVDGYRTLVAVEHREVQAVFVWHVPQLTTRNVPGRGLELDHVRPEPSHQLGCGRTGLNVSHV
jgi:hypothetical protein